VKQFDVQFIRRHASAPRFLVFLSDSRAG
jgi:hypothetical protein